MTYIEAKEVAYIRSAGRCEGCGRGMLFLTPSHRLPQSQFPELKCDPENIDIMCLEKKCHEKVETGAWDQLRNGLQIARYIKSKDPEYYWRRVRKRQQVKVQAMTDLELSEQIADVMEMKIDRVTEEAWEWKLALEGERANRKANNRKLLNSILSN